MNRVPPVTDWDRAIMDTYPHRFAMLWADSRNFEHFDEIIAWAKQNLKRDDFTWKNMTFFFKHREDLMHFMMRWS